MKKTRFKLEVDGVETGEFTSIGEIAELIGCTRQHIYMQTKDGKTTFTHNKKITYKIVDKLD